MQYVLLSKETCEEIRTYVLDDAVLLRISTTPYSLLLVAVFVVTVVRWRWLVWSTSLGMEKNMLR